MHPALKFFISLLKSAVILCSFVISSIVILFIIVINYGGVRIDSPFADIGGLGVELTESNISKVVRDVEIYKFKNGTYPESIGVLKEYFSEKLIPKKSKEIFDLSDIPPANDNPRLLYYRSDDKKRYHLFGIGLDGQPFDVGLGGQPFTQDGVLSWPL